RPPPRGSLRRVVVRRACRLAPGRHRTQRGRTELLDGLGELGAGGALALALLAGGRVLAGAASPLTLRGLLVTGVRGLLLTAAERAEDAAETLQRLAHLAGDDPQLVGVAL